MSDEPRVVPPQLTGLLQAWAAGAAGGPGSFPRPSMCGGALMFVTRDEAMQLGAMTGPGAIRWNEDPERMPNDGQRHSWRVRCRGEITTNKHGYMSALCPWCEGTERAMRAKMRQRRDEAVLSSRGPAGSRRGGFTR